MSNRKRNYRFTFQQRNVPILPQLFAREYGYKRIRIEICPSLFAHRLPFILRGRQIQIKYNDKIFASQWLTSDEILIGTKCNNLGLVNIRTGRLYDIPLLRRHKQSACNCKVRAIQSNANQAHMVCKCGIHAIQRNSNGSLLATGGKQVNDIGVYSLPTLSPICLLENLHKQCVFDLRWIGDDILASCSRDACLALWRLPQCDMNSSPPISHDPGSSITNPSAVPVYPSFSTPIASTYSDDHDDRFRALEHLPTQDSLAVVSMSHRFYIYDVKTLQSSTITDRKPYFHMPLISSDSEAVALRRWPSNPHILSMATRRSVLLFDIRFRSPAHRLAPRIIQPPGYSSSSSIPCVRSLNFSGNVLSYGTSVGNVHFYDLVADKHLPIYFDSVNITKRYVNSCNQDASLNHSNDGLPDLASSESAHNTSPLREDSDSLLVNSENPASSSRSEVVSSYEQWNHEDMNLINFINSLPAHQQVRERTLLSSQVSRRSRPIRITLQALQTDNPSIFIASDEEEFSDSETSVGLENANAPPFGGSLPSNFTSSDDSPHTPGSCQAVYTHEYDPTGVRLFAAGGPIITTYSGNFAVLWE